MLVKSHRKSVSLSPTRWECVGGQPQMLLAVTPPLWGGEADPWGQEGGERDLGFWCHCWAARSTNPEVSLTETTPALWTKTFFFLPFNLEVGFLIFAAQSILHINTLPVEPNHSRTLIGMHWSFDTGLGKTSHVNTETPQKTEVKLPLSFYQMPLDRGLLSVQI